MNKASRSSYVLGRAARQFSTRSKVSEPASRAGDDNGLASCSLAVSQCSTVISGRRLPAAPEVQSDRLKRLALGRQVPRSPPRSSTFSGQTGSVWLGQGPRRPARPTCSILRFPRIVVGGQGDTQRGTLQRLLRGWSGNLASRCEISLRDARNGRALNKLTVCEIDPRWRSASRTRASHSIASCLRIAS